MEKNFYSQNNDVFKAEFKTFERELKRIIAVAKKSYYFKEFSNCRNDMRRTWKSIKEIINKNRRKANFPGKLKLGDLTFTDDLRIANKFNDFFINAGNINRGPLLTNYNDYLNDNVQSSFTFSNTSSVEVFNILKDMEPKNSKGHDELSAKFIKLIGSNIAHPLSLLKNFSL